MRLILLLLLIVGGCATKYGPSGFRGGYSDVQLREDVWKIHFSGNAYTSKSAVKKYLLRRCAEKTLEVGGRYFVILDSTISTSEFTRYQPGSFQATSYNTGSPGVVGAETKVRGTYTPPRQTTYTKDAAVALIKIWNEDPGQAGIDAKLYLESIGQ